MKNRRALTYILSAMGIGLVAVAAAAMPLSGRSSSPAPVPPAPIVPATPPAPLQVAVAPPPVVEPPKPAVVVKPPQVEVIFALDTTGSMSGLISGAKRKIWSLVDFIASGTPQPEVRVGLVAYRDLGDRYTTRFYDLSDDMDQVFKDLSSFRAGGGGDTPEHVSKALHDAVNRTSWSDGQNVVKLIYLVGDAPPHTDYDDGYNYKKIARRAANKGIKIHTIRCGGDPATKRKFAHIAKLGGGRFASIKQSGGVRVVKTPYDEKMATLNRRLMKTAVGYGRGKTVVRRRARTFNSAAPSVLADRVSYSAKRRMAFSGDVDLIGKVNRAGEGGAAGVLAGIANSDLPIEMQKMSKKEREVYVTEKGAEQAKVLDEIAALSTKRSAFIRKEDKKKGGRKDSFDDNVRATIVEETRGVLTY